MYDYIDREIGSLDEGSRFVIWSIRGWTQSVAGRDCPPSALESAFTHSGLRDALPHFHRAMTLLDREGLHIPGFSALTCPRVSEGEAILIALLRAIGRGRRVAADATIALLVRPGAAQMLKRALTAVAILLFARYPLSDGVDGQ